jgi:hypothetical protein
MTLYSGWTDEMSARLKGAVKQLVGENPYLTGRLIRLSGKDGNEENCVVESGAHADFTLELQGPEDFTVDPNGSVEDAVRAVQTSLEPIFVEHSIGSSRDCLETGSPLFRVMLMSLSDSLAAVCMELSHIFADGASYYQFMKYLDCVVNERPKPGPFEWKLSPESVPIPACYSREDKRLHETGWITGYAEKCEQYPARVADLRVVNREAMEHLKRECLTDSIDFLSTNDLVTAGMCELFDDDTVFVMGVNMRGRLKGIHELSVGNLLRHIMFPAGKAAANPSFLRELHKSWVYFGKDNRHIPAESMEACNLSIISNWASLTHILQPKGAQVICHCPAKDYVEKTLGIDIAFVFQADLQGTLIFISNFTVGKRGEELKDKIDKSKLFKRLFIPPERSDRSERRQER